MDFVCRRCAVAVPRVVPTGPHVEVESFGHTSIQQILDEIAESAHALAVDDAESTILFAERTKLVLVRILAFAWHVLTVVYHCLLTESHAAIRRSFL